VTTLEHSRFRPLFADVAEVVRQTFLLPLRHRTTNIKVDIALGLTGFEQQTVSRAEAIDLAGTTVFVATAEDLVIMKVLAGRPQDDVDLRGILLAQGEGLDWGYCVKLADELGRALDQDLVARLTSFRESLGTQ
jgi:hypothetical protein